MNQLLLVTESYDLRKV